MSKSVAARYIGRLMVMLWLLLLLLCLLQGPATPTSASLTATEGAVECSVPRLGHVICMGRADTLHPQLFVIVCQIGRAHV